MNPSTIETEAPDSDLLVAASKYSDSDTDLECFMRLSRLAFRRRSIEPTTGTPRRLSPRRDISVSTLNKRDMGSEKFRSMQTARRSGMAKIN
jgi:hypothetical protein